VVASLQQLWRAVEHRQIQSAGGESVLQKGEDPQHVLFLGNTIGTATAATGSIFVMYEYSPFSK
jgi:hypothetical protein